MSVFYSNQKLKKMVGPVDRVKQSSDAPHTPQQDIGVVPVNFRSPSVPRTPCPTDPNTVSK